MKQTTLDGKVENIPKYIKFSHIWAKLKDLEFTTIRMDDRFRNFCKGDIASCLILNNGIQIEKFDVEVISNEHRMIKSIPLNVIQNDVKPDIVNSVEEFCQKLAFLVGHPVFPENRAYLLTLKNLDKIDELVILNKFIQMAKEKGLFQTNWDGEGSDKYAKNDFCQPAKFFSMLHQKLKNIEKTIPIPLIFPGDDNEIELYWKNEQFLLSISFYPHKQGNILGKNSKNEEIHFYFENKQIDERMITWLSKSI